MKRFYVQYNVRGCNFHVLLSALLKANISVFDVKRCKNQLKFKGCLKDKAQTLAIFSKSLYNDFDYNEKTIFSNISTSIGSIVGMLVFCVILCLPNFIVFKIDIEGSDRTAIQIREVIEAQGLKTLTPYANINSNSLEQTIFQIDNIAFADVNFSCGVLKVFVRESIEDDTRKVATKITSTANGIITAIYTKSGTAIVKVGDSVSVGDTLIDGVVYSKHKDKYIESEADGEVFATCEFELQEVILKRDIILAKTGEVQSGTYITLFGIDIGKRKSSFEFCQRDTSSSIIHSIIPITITRWNEYEQQYQVCDSNMQYKIDVARDRLLEQFFFQHTNYKINQCHEEIIELEDQVIFKMTLCTTMKISEAQFGKA